MDWTTTPCHMTAITGPYICHFVPKNMSIFHSVLLILSLIAIVPDLSHKETPNVQNENKMKVYAVFQNEYFEAPTFHLFALILLCFLKMAARTHLPQYTLEII